MNVFHIIVAMGVSVNLVAALVYAYLYAQYKHRYLAFWALGCFILIARLAQAGLYPAPLDTPTRFIHQAALIAPNVLMLLGVNTFLEIQSRAGWYIAVSFAAAAAAFDAVMTPPFFDTTPATYLAVGLFNGWIGFLLLRRLRIRGCGKHITGLSFILFGVHSMALPVLGRFPELAPWGYFTDAILRIGMVIGILIVYYEKTRGDLEHSERYYRLLAEYATDVVFYYQFAPTPHFDYISPSVARLTGYTPYEFYRNPALANTLVHAQDKPLLKRLLKNLHSGSQTLTYRLIRRDGTIAWIEETCVPIFGAARQCIGFHANLSDISARKLLEQKVSRLDNLNLVGQMAANVAHEIRNPITTIRGYLQMFFCKNEFGKYKEQLLLVLSELDRTSQIISEYLSFTRDNAGLDFKRMQLCDILQSLYPLLESDAAASSKTLRMDLRPLPPLYLNEKEIRQLVLNLVRNALEAIPGGGAVVIRTHVEHKAAILSVTDDGPGIPAEIINHIGQPFFTTKAAGTGLGLPICYNIAKRHQAEINVRTAPTGTTFAVKFFPPPEKEAEH